MNKKDKEEIEENIKAVENCKKCIVHFTDECQKHVDRLREKLKQLEAKP